MEGTVKVRLLLTSALFLFVQIPTMQAQVTVDVVKITCEQLLMQALPFTSREVILWETTVIDAVKKMGLSK
jgi:hypothetical protein